MESIPVTTHMDTTTALYQLGTTLTKGTTQDTTLDMASQDMFTLGTTTSTMDTSKTMGTTTNISQTMDTMGTTTNTSHTTDTITRGTKADMASTMDTIKTTTTALGSEGK